MQIEVSKVTFDKLFSINLNPVDWENEDDFMKVYYNNGRQRGFIFTNYQPEIVTYHLLDINS